MSRGGAARPTAVLFDLDGTLVDSLGDITDALNHALLATGHPARSEDAVRACVGEGARNLVRLALPPEARQDAVIDAALALYRARYRANLVVRTKPYPGIEPLLAALREAGVPLAVVTNKPEGPAAEITRRLFAPGTFAAVVGEIEGRARKPDPAPAQAALATLGAPGAGAVFVGDSAIDLATARNARLRGIGVAWGIRGRAELETVDRAEIVDDASELARALGV